MTDPTETAPPAPLTEAEIADRSPSSLLASIEHVDALNASDGGTRSVRIGPLGLRKLLAAAEREATMRRAMRMDEPWPLQDVLAKLAEAADILLNHHSYDGHGWELINHARNSAREIAELLASLPKEGT